MSLRSVILLGAGALAASVPVLGQDCFHGDASSGMLTFTGAIEGERFTGRFGEFSVRYCIDGESPPAHAIEVRVGLASADSDNRDRDTTLMQPEFFAVERHPEALWRSTGISREGDGYRADGELTLKGVTAPQPVRYTLDREAGNLVASGRFVLSGDAEVDRSRFDVGTGEFADPQFIRNAVVVEFRVELGLSQENR